MVIVGFLAEAVGFFLVVAAAFVVLTLIASFLRFYWLVQRIEQAAPETGEAGNVFLLQVVQQLGGLHQSPGPFTIMMLEPVRSPGNAAPEDEETVTDGLDQWIEHIRTCLRKQDFVIRYEGDVCAVLGRFDSTRLATVTNRLTQSLSKAPVKTPAGVNERWPVRIGVACYPEHGDRAQSLVEHARTALVEARTEAPGAVRGQPVDTAEPASRPSTPPPPKPTGKRETNTLLDAETGVLRADRLGTALQKIVARQRRDDLGVSVLYVGIDGYAQYADHYGEEAVASIVKGLADLLSDQTRETDVIGRADVAEFVVVMDCPPSDALIAAQRLVAAVKRLPLRHGAMRLKITASIGVAGYPDHSGKARDMYMFAQRALTEAQRRGRGLVTPYQEAMDAVAQKRKQVDAF